VIGVADLELDTVKIPQGVRPAQAEFEALLGKGERPSVEDIAELSRKLRICTEDESSAGPDLRRYQVRKSKGTAVGKQRQIAHAREEIKAQPPAALESPKSAARSALRS